MFVVFSVSLLARFIVNRKFSWQEERNQTSCEHWWLISFIVFNSAFGGYQFLRFVHFLKKIQRYNSYAITTRYEFFSKLKFRWEWENIVALPVPYLYPSLKKGYIQCTETLFLIVSYPFGNYFPWWDHPFGDPLWGPNLILFLFISRPEKSFMISKNIV